MTTPVRAPNSVPPPASFPRLEKYELIEEIGHGGMATVYRALDPRLGRDVAVKVIHKHLRENAEVAKRFVAEARAAAKLRHPGIVEVYDVSNEDDAERYLVVELLRGTTLRKILQMHREIPAEVGAAIVLELCDGLEHAHEAGIIHRDVKPENVLVELPSDRATPAISSPRSSSPEDPKSEGEARDSGNRPGDRPSERRKMPRPEVGVVVKLTDFGIAKVLDAQGVTSTGQVLGSPAHMAPEQIEGGDIDPRTDVFALGVLMYECLVGHLPFVGKNPAQVLRRVLDGTFSPADLERPSVGGRWARIVAGALAREMKDRTASAAILGEQIRHELEAVGIQDPRAEVAAFFRDPDAYTADLRMRLVGRLVERGEEARRTGDVFGAAADFNRALALAPHDLSILKRVSSLHGAANRRELAKRVGLIASASVALGFAAYGTARYVKARPPETMPIASVAPPAPAPTAMATSTDEATAEPPSSAVLAPTASASERIRHTTAVVGPAIATAVSAGSAPRRVKFTIMPRGATLRLDGQPRNWLSETFELAPGPHSVEIEPPNECCKKLQSSVTVAPDPPDHGEQEIGLQLELNPAKVRLVNAPAGAEATCAALGRTFRGASFADMPLPKVEWTGHCTFSVPSSPDVKTRQAAVTLRAGERNDVPWPGE